MRDGDIGYVRGKMKSSKFNGQLLTIPCSSLILPEKLPGSATQQVQPDSSNFEAPRATGQILKNPSSWRTPAQSYVPPLSLPSNPLLNHKLTYRMQMTEALLNNERCFLEQPAWKDVLRSVTTPDAPLISDRSSIVVELMVLKCNIPGLCVDVTNMICHQADPDPSFIIEIACRIHQLRVDLLKWHGQYENILRNAPAILPGTAEFDRRCKVFATYLSCMIISSRLLGSISPTERSELEEETQVLTGQMLALELEVKNASLQTYLFMAQTLGVSHATIKTSELWRDSSEKGERIEDENGNEQPDTPESPGPRSLIESWRFERWNKLMGRKTS